MTTVERVKQICKERKIPISKLESDLKFGNAYIRGLKKGVFPNDRLKLIADYLDVSVEYLMTGEEREFSKEQALLDIKISQDLKLKRALKKYFCLSEDKKKYIIELINLLSEP